MTATRRLDPDALAVLEEQRAFLLRSIEDLDAELEAGDIDAGDHAELKDDYTRRAAEIIRAIERHEAALSARPGVRWQQIMVWLLGLALVGGLSGVLIARTSGARGSGDSITGGVRSSVVTRLNQAQALLGDQTRWDEAIELYESVLDDDPSSVEALTYRAWLQYRDGESGDSQLPAFEEVARLDPGYADAVVFHTIVLADAGRYGEAADVLNRLDLAAAPEPVRGLVEQRGLAGEVYGEASYEALVAGTPSLAELGLSADNALAAAGYLLASGKDERTVSALKLYAAVREVEPDNPAALSREATLLALTGTEDLLDRALQLVDRAVEANPDDPEARLSRATVRVLEGNDLEGACADLEALADFPDVPQTIEDQARSLSDANC